MSYQKLEGLVETVALGTNRRGPLRGIGGITLSAVCVAATATVVGDDDRCRRRCLRGCRRRGCGNRRDCCCDD